MLQYPAFAVRNDLGVEYDTLREGAGALNGAGAVALARSIDTSRGAGHLLAAAAAAPVDARSAASTARGRRP